MLRDKTLGLVAANICCGLQRSGGKMVSGHHNVYARRSRVKISREVLLLVVCLNRFMFAFHNWFNVCQHADGLNGGHSALVFSALLAVEVRLAPLILRCNKVVI